MDAPDPLEAPDTDPYAPPGEEGGGRGPGSDNVGLGMLQVLIGHGVAIAVLAIVQGGDLGSSALLAAFFAGLYQWLYVLPMLVLAHRRGAKQTAKGIWIVAGLSTLPTCACFGLLATYR